MAAVYTVRVEKLREIVCAIFEKNGLSKEYAAIIADNLLDANIRGMDSHGVLRVENYLKRIHSNGTNPAAEVKVIRETPVSALLDGDNGPGAVVGVKAVEICRKKAEEMGIACVTVRNSNHYGTSAYYCERLAGDDMIAFSCSNVEALMGPPGATKAAIGNNPFCMVAPAGKYPAIVSDMATSQIALGKVLNYRMKGMKLPGPWGIDGEGNATDDAASTQFLAPMGAHKGYGIAVLLEILSSLLAGGHFGNEINSMYGDIDKPNNLSHFFMAFKISIFRDLEEYRADMDRFIEYLMSIPTADGGHIIVPGQLEEASRKRTMEKGIELPEKLAGELIEMLNGRVDGDIGEYFA